MYFNNVPIVDDALAAGISVAIEASAGIMSGYFDGNTLSLTTNQTGASGEGGFLSVPEGWVTITATLVATNQKIGKRPPLFESGRDLERRSLSAVIWL